MIRVYADFNSSDEQGRVWCLQGLEGHALVEGMRVVFYVPEDFEVEGTLTFDGYWRGVPDWATIVYVTGA